MRFWNILFVLLVLAPVLTGGIILRGGKIEYTNPGPALLFLLVWFYAKRNVWRLEENALYILARKVWRGWRHGLEKTPLRTLLLANSFVGLLWALASLRRHWSFSSGAADLGIFTNAIWNLSHGNGYISSVKSGVNLFTDHQSYFFFLFAPIYRIAPYPETLLILQALGLSAGGSLLFLLGKRLQISARLCALLPLVYWCYLPVRSANLFDFHPEVFLLPLALLFLLLLESRRSFLFILPIYILALSCKESAAPVFCGIALVLFLRKRYGWSIFLLLSSLTLFFWNIKIMPGLFGAQYSYSSVYQNAFANLWAWSRVKFLFATLAPFAFVPLLSPQTMLAALPGYAMLFLTAGSQRLGLGFHYAIEPAIGIFWALAYACASPWVRKQESRVFWALLLCAGIFFGRSEIFQIRKYSPSAHQEWLAAELMPKLDAEKSLSASSALVPHVANRPWVHFLPVLEMRDHQLVDCVLYDPGVNNSPLADSEWLKIKANPEYEQEYECAGFLLLHKKNTSCLMKIPSCRKS